MLKLGIRCVRRAVSGADLTDFGKAVRVSLLLVLSCVLSPAFAQATEGCAPAVGSGTSSSPYRIAMLCELQGISLSPAAHYELVANIDASTATDFSPIATFSGSFVNTGKYEISSLTINRGAENNVGLFSRLAAGAKIRGIILADSRMTGLDNVGSLVGFSEGVIVDSSATGSVSGRNRVGGLVGHSRGDISGSYAAGSVSGNDGVGGLVGQKNGSISGSYAASSVFGDDGVGGLVGYQESGSGIIGSYATGSVTGRNYIGGLVGTGHVDIDYSFATGLVFGSDNVGGLVGYQGNSISIRNSYATGSVSGDDIVGGLVGYLESSSSLEYSYATGSVFGQGNFVGGLVGRKFRYLPEFDGTVSDSYYAAGRRNNGLGEERTFAQLRCPMTAGAACPSGSQESSYLGWNVDAWDFGSATDLPQLLSNRNLELNLKPYIEGSAELVVGTGFTGITRFPLEADYPGSPDGSVVLTWSLLFDASSRLGDFFYFELEDGSTSTEANGSSATLAVVGDDRLAAGRGFYIVLKNNVSANGDRIRVRTVEAPYIFRNDTVSARIGSTATFSFSVGYAGTPGQPVNLTWSLFGVPPSLNHLVYFDLGDGTTSTTFADPGRLTGDDSVVTLVVVGNEELAGKSFYVELKNDISANDDRVLIQTEAGQPYILLDGDISPAPIGSTTTFSFSVGYTGSSEPATLTWSLSGVPPSLKHLAYFDLGDGTTSTTFADRGKRTADSSPVTLMVVGNEELAGTGFYVELKNNISDNVDRVPVRIAGASPLVVGGSEQIGTIWAGSLSNSLRFSATDPDSPYSGGAGLEWSFSSTDITDDLTVRFSGTTRGGTVGVEVVRTSLDLYGVGSFVLEVTSLAGVKTTVTVTIETVCSLVPGDDLMAGQAGAGASDNPYQIKRLCQLQDISSSPTAHYELVAHIDASETRDWNDGAGFEPIAIGDTTGFSGSFVNRGGFEIRSLTISRGDTDSVGLFSALAGSAVIEGVKLVGSRTVGGDVVGSLAGLSAGVIDGCSATGFVSGEGNLGGLVGYDFGTISDSFAASTVTGTGDGFFGLNYNVGGLAGYAFSFISGSYATGSVSGGSQVGGLVGYQEGGSIYDSYATGSVSGQIDVGGLVGQGAGNINNGYAAGSVSGVENAGGLVGDYIPVADNSSTIRNSYYAARGRDNGLGEERTFAQLRCQRTPGATCPPGSQENTYQDWDMNVWSFGSATDLPQLSGNRNSDLNRKPYINSSTDLVVGTGLPGTTRFSLEADYPGTPVGSVVLTWSLLFDEESSTLSDLIYFVRDGGTTSTEANGSVATLEVVGDEGLAGKDFYVVLKNNISASDDRVLIQVQGSTALTRPLRVRVYLGGAVR